jgi:hypothetical protein
MAAGVTAMLLVSAGAVRAAASRLDPASESGFVSHIAAERSSRGLGALRVADDLVAVARRHATEMATEQKMYDDPNLGTEVQGWQSLGGNAGEGSSVDQLHQALMASPVHRANILDAQFSEVGVGVAQSGGTLWVSQVFRQPTRSSTARAAAAPAAPSRPSAPPAAPATTLAITAPPATEAPPSTAPPTTVTARPPPGPSAFAGPGHLDLPAAGVTYQAIGPRPGGTSGLARGVLIVLTTASIALLALSAFGVGRIRRARTERE